MQILCWFFSLYLDMSISYRLLFVNTSSTTRVQTVFSLWWSRCTFLQAILSFLVTERLHSEIGPSQGLCPKWRRGWRGGGSQIVYGFCSLVNKLTSLSHERLSCYGPFTMSLTSIWTEEIKLSQGKSQILLVHRCDAHIPAHLFLRVPLGVHVWYSSCM